MKSTGTCCFSLEIHCDMKFGSAKNIVFLEICVLKFCGSWTPSMNTVNVSSQKWSLVRA